MNDRPCNTIAVPKSINLDDFVQSVVGSVLEGLIPKLIRMSLGIAAVSLLIGCAVGYFVRGMVR